MNHHTPDTQRLAFEAFQTLQQTHYTAYARAHLGPRDADHAVRDTFTAILAAWRDIITDPAPAQRAWEHLRTHVHRHSPRTDRDDIRTLAALGYNTQATAALTGLCPGKVRFLERPAGFGTP
ncbi:hypothetical protein ACFV2B_07315 [Streptomyces lavendulae]|uniref:hypothetical protein n=1 Tax=Streptomyces lavendulae TaxID=1914 RepID=UPI0036CBD160